MVKVNNLSRLKSIKVEEKIKKSKLTIIYVQKKIKSVKYCKVKISLVLLK